MKTFYSYSFGCRVNEAEKEEIDRQMLENGFIYEAKKPDIFIINSCCVTQKAEREVRQLIYRVKKENPKVLLVVTGCAATYWLRNKLYQTLPVNLIIDNINKQFLSDQPVLDRSGLPAGKAGREKMVRTSKFINSGRLIVKIQDGCQRFCSYCIVPYLRGQPKSERIKNLELKIKNYQRKVSEVILTAINTEAFGIDTGEKFVDLVKTIINKTKIPRISFGSIHPWSIDEKFLRFYQEYFLKKRLVNFFHVPLQSGSNKMLTLMKRGYKREEMLKKLQSIKRLNKYAFLSTDVIVGFPGETEKDFEETYDFLEKSSISRFHIFRFSKRKGTAAYFMTKYFKEPKDAEKIKRAKILAELGRKKYEEFLRKNVGRTSSVLFLQKRINGFHEGLLDNQLPIFVPIQPRRSYRPGRIINVKIIEFKKGRLFGKII